MDVPDRKLGLMLRIHGLFSLLGNEMYWGYNPLILTFDPNFLGHPSIGDTPIFQYFSLNHDIGRKGKSASFTFFLPRKMPKNWTI